MTTIFFLVIALVLVLLVGIFLLARALGTQTESQAILESRVDTVDWEATGAKNLAELELTQPFSERVLKPVVNKLGNIVARNRGRNNLEALDDKLALAGYPWDLDARSFIAVQLVSVVVGFGLGILLFFLLAPSLVTGILILLICAFVGYSGPVFLVGRKVRARQDEVLLAMPGALDLMTICMEAGLGFDQSLQRVASHFDNILGSEFNRVLQEMQFGTPRRQALESMANRIRIEELTRFVRAVVQAEVLGVSLVNVMQIQSDELRRLRRLRAEEKGQKAPIKMIFVIVGCIFPTIFIVLLGPAAIAVYNVMSGGS